MAEKKAALLWETVVHKLSESHSSGLAPSKLVLTTSYHHITLLLLLPLRQCREAPRTVARASPQVGYEGDSTKENLPQGQQGHQLETADHRAAETGEGAQEIVSSLPHITRTITASVTILSVTVSSAFRFINHRITPLSVLCNILSVM